MGVVINANFSTAVATGNLSYGNVQPERDLRMRSADPIAIPADDSAAPGVSIQFSGAVTPAAVASYTVATVASYLQQQDKGLNSAEQILTRVNALWTLYREASKTPEELAGYDNEYRSLQKELAALTENQFNGTALFGAAGSGVVERVTVAEEARPVSVSAKDLADPWVGVGVIADPEGAGTLDDLSAEDLAVAIENVATMREKNTSEQSFLGFTVEMLARKKANAEAADGGIANADAAEESTTLVRSEILVKTGAAIVAQANENGETALRLLETAVITPAAPDEEEAAVGSASIGVQPVAGVAVQPELRIES